MRKDRSEIKVPYDAAVLIVDDDAAFADLIETAFSRAGFQTGRAGNGKEGLEKIESFEPHLVLTDLMMPDMGGYEFLRELRAGEGRGLPVIVMSSRKMDPSTVEMLRMEHNVSRFFAKPLKAAELIACVRKELGMPDA